MSIASAIVAAQGRVADAYTAISNKGGTLPATQNLANMPTAINSIPSGGGSSAIDTIFSGEIDANGVYTPAFMLEYEGDVSFDGIKTIDTSAYATNEKGTFASYFYHEITSNARQRLKTRLIKGKISFPDLETIIGDSYCFYGFCNGQTKITELSFDKLETLSGTNMTTVFNYLCADASSLRIARFPKLTSFNGSSVFMYAFRNTSTLDVYFNGLTTATFSQNSGQLNGIMSSSGTSGIHTIHFPSNLESTIQGLSGYPLFSGTDGYVVLAFDLPATE